MTTRQGQGSYLKLKNDLMFYSKLSAQLKADDNFYS